MYHTNTFNRNFMKATVVKNNNFETIGFEVTASARILFSWGVSPSSPLYWTKPVNVNDWMTEIFELVRIKAQIGEAENFVFDFFEVAKMNGLVEENQAVKFAANKIRLERLNGQMENIIKNII